MNRNLLASDRAAVVASIDPDAYAAATYESGWVDMGMFGTIMSIIQAGDLGASGTVDAKIEQATDSSGTGAKDVTGKAITQLTQAGGDSNKQAIINCRADDLDIANDFSHVRLSVTIAAAACDLGAVVLAMDARHGSASDNDNAAVAEIVA